MDLEQRIQAIRQGTPNCVKELFEIQNRICDLCGRPIQDLILAHLDHSIPVIKYAQAWDIALDDAVRECNSLENLRIVHSKCNLIKLDKTRDEWFEQGLDKLVEETRRLTTNELDALRYKLGEGGRIAGRKNVETGRLEYARKCISPERKIGGGKKAGRLAAMSGRMSEMGKKGGSISGSRNSLIARHSYQHLRRNFYKFDCALCQKESAFVELR